MKKLKLIPAKLILIVLFVWAWSGCQKNETIKTDPIISWENPADISFGTLLDTLQLNATADVPGTFVYTPAAGTKLNEGVNQELKVEFNPTDATVYNTSVKTVKINVLPASLSTAVFNPDIIYGLVTDIEGNIYKTVTIGTQTWMAENLRTTKYRNGDAIPEVTGNTAWIGLSTDAYCNYENSTDEIKIATMGRLYNWFAVTDSRNIAPAGWHVATDAEWSTLTSFLGNDTNAGGKLKETGNTHWNSPNSATNASGFTALPGGRREYNTGLFINDGYDGFWWTSSAYNPDYSWYRYLHFDVSAIYRANFHKQYGFSVRCVKDQIE
jgi:uncharacterized protein (TIGR02145 family)